MTWASRIRLLAGTILVLVVAALATYHLNETRGRATSASAQILAESYAVGTPYAGLVADQLADVGDDVVEGQPLFVIDSAALTYDLAHGFVSDPPEFTQVDEQGRLVVLASGDGRLTQVTGQRGTFVPSASALATVQRADTLYVQGEYTLTAKEYSRLPDGADVTITLPNETALQGTVERVEVTTVAGEAQAVVRMTSEALKDGSDNGLVSAGTPVVAQIELTNEGMVTTVAGKVRTYVEGLLR
ncbi:HlyD family efflux transporter periplasmic adaptor subunit [Cellulomonas sp. zg-ZUI222]|uniref:HlyD family efflux transporter periplasmic adaptor subunit n=1 Tax=Cellulomonas wangleii TaxID=2816956 RepID=A0ABX8D687_9CELL|nr:MULTISPECIES: HlyD family efflux transporter periplasmic adaptor subunit [Cellulomonas]MBO0899078.1 HlyD family efflux transporter periplasmic adaptor subunit [Cellulomonas sp. zg-ZUI22]MBO0919931.1 HlyD family efflux transporter periplasmic adaptor subunit [Cellulomonas wangleii]MBO0923640.1 HlyD family efflux transporter periplasmic adaptor subunit [Cellulomonas wangleii]QVI61961.1 HlyD family efflux transporter periplasmic adaptor subunit [Cellulomonas wangleii]